MVEISCAEVWRELSNYVDNDLDASLRARMQEHFRYCNHCTALLDGTRNVLKLVGDDRSFDLPSGFSARLYERLAKRK